MRDRAARRQHPSTGLKPVISAFEVTVRRLLPSFALVLVLPLVSRGQTMPPQTHAGFEAGQNILGAVIGFGGIGSANASIGGRFEHGIRNLPDLGNGLLSLAVDADFYHYSDPLFPGASWTYIPLGGTINYHFRLDDRRIDPFIGVGLGYSVASVSGGGSTYTASSSLYAITRLGGRYFFTPNAAIQADAGAGAAALNVGLAWKM